MKKLSALFIMAMLIFAAAVCVHAEEFEVKSTSFPRGTAHTEYSAQIEMVDGNEGYTFAFTSYGFYPKGLTLSEDGLLSGTPTGTGYFSSMYVLITHNGVSRVAQFNVRIDPIKIRVRLKADTVQYDGEEHYAEAECFSYPGALTTPLEDVTPTIKYGAQRLNSAVNAGTYVLSVYVPAGYSLVKPVLGAQSLKITPLPVTELSVEDYTVPWDGNTHAMPEENISLTPAEAGYTVEYRKSGASSYTTTPPSDSGVYSVRVTTSNQNYEETEATATLTIQAQEVVMTVKDNSDTAVYDGQVHKISFDTDTPDAAYTVSYTDSDGQTVENPKNAGTYTAHINLTNTAKYSLANGSTATLTISPKPITFSAEDIPFDGQEHTPAVNVSPAFIENDVTYDIIYKKQGDESGTELTKLRETGTYDVNITINSGNYRVADDSFTTISVTSQSVNFTISGDLSVEYDGDPHTVTAEPDQTIPSEAYSVTYSKDGNPVDAPTEAGVYTVDVKFNDGYDDGRYTKGSVSPNTLTITQKALTFAVTGNNVSYDENPHQATVTATDTHGNTVENTSEHTIYVVKYQKGSNTPTDDVTNPDTYNIVITVTDSNYTKQGSDSFTMTITTQTVNFTVTGNTSFVYGDNVPHVVSVTTDPSIPDTAYTLVYTNTEDSEKVYKQSEYPNGPSDAGTYTVDVEITDTGYSKGSVTNNSMTVSPVVVHFNVTGNEDDIPYDGQEHEASVAAASTEPAGRDVPDFTVTYKKDEEEPVSKVTQVGTYKILVSFGDNDGNFVAASDFDESITITSVAKLNFTAACNTPAAMIYHDDSHNETWQEETFAYFEEHRSFDTDHLPEGCSTGITYSSIPGVYDFDADKFAVIVSSLEDFSDPGMEFNGTQITASDEPEQITSGLYKVTYTYDTDKTLERYIAVIGRFGDYNGDKSFNAIDANYIDYYLSVQGTGSVAVADIAQARVWDVNKDGVISAADSAAIRNRFRQRLVPFYPWI